MILLIARNETVLIPTTVQALTAERKRTREQAEHVSILLKEEGTPTGTRENAPTAIINCKFKSPRRAGFFNKLCLI